MKELKSKKESKKIKDAEIDTKCMIRETVYAIFDCFSNPIWVADHNGKFIHFNKSWLNFRGKTEKQEIAGNWFDNLHEEDRKFFEKTFKSAIKNDNSFRIKFRILGKEKKYHWLSCHGNPLYDAAGNSCGYFGASIDKTDGKLAKELLNEEKRKLSLVIDLAGIFIVFIGKNQEVLMINKRGCEILQYQEADILGKNWFDNFLPKHLVEKTRENFAKMMKAEIVSFKDYENPVLSKNGKERIISWHNSVMRDDKNRIIGVISTGEDVTDRLVASGKLQEKVEELEKVNNLMVDRELKMIKLKKEIKKLQGIKLR